MLLRFRFSDTQDDDIIYYYAAEAPSNYAILITTCSAYEH